MTRPDRHDSALTFAVLCFLASAAFAAWSMAESQRGPFGCSLW
jgi:hypothetical protein